EHAPVNGLQPVAGIRQRAPDDNAHRVIEIGAAHLLFDIDGNEAGAAGGRRNTFKRELGIFIVWHKRSFQARRKAAERNRKSGAGLAWAMLYFTSSERVSTRPTERNKSLFCLILWTYSTPLRRLWMFMRHGASRTWIWAGF